jgi:excisionase family DNA binding protein
VTVLLLDVMANYRGDEATTLPFGRRVLPEMLNVEELAELLRVDRKTVYDAIAKGEIPGARRVARAIRVSRDAVIDWLRGQGGGSRSRR